MWAVVVAHLVANWLKLIMQLAQLFYFGEA